MSRAWEQQQAQKDTEELQRKACTLFSCLIFKILFFIPQQTSLLHKVREGCWSKLSSLAFKAFLVKKKIQSFRNM